METTIPLQKRFLEVRDATLAICAPLKTEDYVVQPIPDVSPIKWHLGHTTWLLETVLLKPYMIDYKEYDKDFAYIFNSYYEGLGNRISRHDRGNLTRPTLEEIKAYREYVNMHMEGLIASTYQNNERSAKIKELVEIALQHEQQHQELIMMDAKYILGTNPLYPAFNPELPLSFYKPNPIVFVDFMEQLSSIGISASFRQEKFHFDNESPNHLSYIHGFEIANRPTTNGEYLAFVEDRGYNKSEFWHMDGWEWLKANKITYPLYWHHKVNGWHEYTEHGMHMLDLNDFVNHIGFYEAAAYARWKGCRLPTEAEWEIAAKSGKIGDIGRRWEWTNSAYLPYPGYKPYEGVLKEYNGKFMINQMVLRGWSDATPKGHSRFTYRNFFQPEKRWQFSGVRLAKDH